MSDNLGCVYLIGAGCGSRELLTLKGLDRLKSCDALVYDDLIDDGILDIVPESCLKIYMGKRSGKHSAAQEEISAKLIELASEGKKVARLKGGDPFVFGRGGEEIIALQKAGIPFEVIPGISSSIAIPASAGIPVTHRGVSRSFHVITAHSAANDGMPEDLPELAKLHGTLVFLMGLGKLKELAQELQKEGMSGDTPAAVISGGNSPNPAAVRGCLRDIAERSRIAGVKPPAVIVVGKTAAMELNKGSIKYPLEGIRVGLTGTDSICGKLTEVLEKEGAAVQIVERSVVEELPAENLREKLCDGKTHWLVFTSANGVRVFFKRLREQKIDIRHLHSCKFAVIGAPTGSLLSDMGIYPELCPAVFTSEALGRELCEKVGDDEDVILLRADNGAEILPKMLREKGIAVEDIAIYSLRPDESLTERNKDRVGKLDYLTFSSAGGVRLFCSQYGEIPEGPKCVCIGEVTAKELSKHTERPFIVAESSTVQSIAEAVISDVQL